MKPKPDTTAEGTSVQMTVDECIEVAETGSDGKLTAEQLSCPHCECAWHTDRCCHCGAEWVDDNGR